MLENEQVIVEQAKRDEQAFEILYNHYFPIIYGYIFKRTGSREVTEDIVAEVFIKAFVKIGGFKWRGYTFGAWLFKIAGNKLIDYYRKNGRQSNVSLDQASSLADKTDLSKEVMVKEEKILVEKILLKLPPRYQAVINLRYFTDLPMEEIAAVLKVSPNNASVLLYRALKKFHKIYEKDVK